MRSWILCLLTQLSFKIEGAMKVGRKGLVDIEKEEITWKLKNLHRQKRSGVDLKGMSDSKA